MTNVKCRVIDAKTGAYLRKATEEESATWLTNCGILKNPVRIGNVLIEEVGFGGSWGWDQGVSS